MQRALALSLIQVYAGILENEEGILSKPIMFLLMSRKHFYILRHRIN